MNIAIVVEGPSDRAAYPVLMERIRTGLRVNQIRDCGGKTKLKNSFVGLLKELERNPAWSIERVFVIQDSDCKPHEEIEARLQSKLSESHFAPEFQVRCFATKCVLESWLLADPRAINTISRRRGKHKQVESVQVDLDSYKDAKKLFWEQLSKAELQAVPPVYAEIASVIELGQISSRCLSFRRFKEKILA